jgi:hypothetical protein
MRVLVGNRFGVILDEMTPNAGGLSWILNGIGKAVLSFAKSDAKTTVRNLRVGNRVYIDFDNGLPAWGGTMELPRHWDKGTVSVTCYEIGYLLKYRPTRKLDQFYNMPVGGIFSELLRREEEKDPLGITRGTIWMGGRPQWPVYHYKSVWDVFTDGLRKNESCDFRFIPYLDSTTIKFRAEFYQVAGSDKTSSVMLAEGRNVGEDLSLEEQGAVVNTQIAIGSGSTWGDERKAMVARDLESMALYGLRGLPVVYSGVNDVAALEMQARNALADSSEPRRIFTLPVTNNEPGLYGAYDLGDVVRAVLPTYGFGGYDGTLRILAREFNPGDGGCQLQVDENNAPNAWVYQDGTGGEVVEEEGS